MSALITSNFKKDSKISLGTFKTSHSKILQNAFSGLIYFFPRLFRHLLKKNHFDVGKYKKQREADNVFNRKRSKSLRTKLDLFSAI